eukprot:447533-Amphidinium_carterae.1
MLNAKWSRLICGICSTCISGDTLRSFQSASQICVKGLVPAPKGSSRSGLYLLLQQDNAHVLLKGIILSVLA